MSGMTRQFLATWMCRIATVWLQFVGVLDLGANNGLRRLYEEARYSEDNMYPEPYTPFVVFLIRAVGNEMMLTGVFNRLCRQGATKFRVWLNAHYSAWVQLEKRPVDNGIGLLQRAMPILVGCQALPERRLLGEEPSFRLNGVQRGFRRLLRLEQRVAYIQEAANIRGCPDFNERPEFQTLVTSLEGLVAQGEQIIVDAELARADEVANFAPIMFPPRPEDMVLFPMEE